MILADCAVTLGTGPEPIQQETPATTPPHRDVNARHSTMSQPSG